MTCAVDGCTEPMRALGLLQGALLVDAVVGVAVDLTPLVLSAGQVSAAARCVARMCPDDRAVILAALGLS